MKTKLINTLYSLSLLLFISAFGFQHNPPSGWYQQFMPDISGASIRDITFTDSLTGYTVTSIGGSNSYILKTTNGGDNWSVKFSHTQPFVRIIFVDSTTGFTNAFTKIFKTTNSGENWTEINLPQIFGDDMFVLNEDTIWLAMSESLTGGVFRTTNGGANWVRQLNAGGQNPSRIYMYDANFGFITNNTGTYLRRTTDSGQNWEVINGQNGFTDLKFADANTGWKSFDSVRTTTDGGTTWKAQTLPSGGDIIISEIRKFSKVNKDTLWGVGGYVLYTGVGSRGMIYRTTNGGNNWLYQVPDTNINIGRYNHIAFHNQLIGWAYSGGPGVHTFTGGDSIFYPITKITQISSEIPSTFVLHQNYPNPFNPVTNIKYEIRSGSEVKLVVYDVSGKLIKILVSQKQTAGTYQYTFEGSGLSSGVYFYSLEIENEYADLIFRDVKKMILVK